MLWSSTGKFHQYCAGSRNSIHSMCPSLLVNDGSILANKCCLLVAGCGADAVLLVVEERVFKRNRYAPLTGLCVLTL
ncbi:hypothetical protein E1301_Tti016234 [Triplophysa tibetana]|uniref:Uncharacterized protein n=1 Tax=Triplophysa tibetana TaxID=1572043 RepID=A0A5A9NB13_9TELE|nr:hypothetical protein E1301_Tti016234 [Triplophysa tibetana]